MEAIGILAGGVAHDFNNLLSVILSYNEFAIRALRDGDPLKDDLLEVKKAADRATALTRQLLAFGRKQLLQPVPLNLNQVAEGVEKMLRRILGEDIDYIQVLAPDLGVVRADPGQIEQVLMNLVVNARDAMSEGGKLTIETSNVDLDEEYAAHHVGVKPGAYVRLAVTDTGCGMDEQIKSQLFEPFFTTKEKGKGTGLGLSTVYGIVQQSGGNIWVYSELGLGTTFKIYLPRELSVKATAARLRAILEPALGTETILVVEDEEALRKVARRFLEAAGYTVLTAGSGDEALLISAQHAGTIHLLLTDVVMPRMSGKALAQAILKTRPMAKVLYTSGYADNAFVHNGVVDEGTHFIGKPFTATDVTRKIRSVLDGDFDNISDRHEQAVGKADDVVNWQPLDRASLQALPEEILVALRKAVAAARYDDIVAIVETIRITAPSMANGLRRMAEIFDYDGIRELLGR
jgi:CheY-like chemotaxis protein